MTQSRMNFSHGDFPIRRLQSTRDRLVPEKRALYVRKPRSMHIDSPNLTFRPRMRYALPKRRHQRANARRMPMDGLAVAAEIDPAELRLRCYSDRNQNVDQPFSSKALRECYRQGAEAFGWDKRNPEPRSMRDGDDLVGWGMATGIWDAFQAPITVPIVLSANGHAEVACATSDIGTGTYTIMAQVAADKLWAAARKYQRQAGRLQFAPVAGRGRLMDCSIGVERDSDDRSRDLRRALASDQAGSVRHSRTRRRAKSRLRTASW